MAYEGTPHWLMRLEQVKAQLKPENYAIWLQQEAHKHDIPDEVIAAQLEQMGVKPNEHKKVAATSVNPDATQDEVDAADKTRSEEKAEASATSIESQTKVVTGLPTEKPKRGYNKRKGK